MTAYELGILAADQNNVPGFLKQASARSRYIGFHQPWVSKEHDAVIGMHGGGGASTWGGYGLASSPTERRLPSFFYSNPTGEDGREPGWSYIDDAELQHALSGRTNLYSIACNPNTDGACPQWYDAHAGGSLQRVVMQPAGRNTSAGTPFIPSNQRVYDALNFVGRPVNKLLGRSSPIGPLHDYQKRPDGSWEDTGPVANRWLNHSTTPLFAEATRVAAHQGLGRVKRHVATRLPARAMWPAVKGITAGQTALRFGAKSLSAAPAAVAKYVGLPGAAAAAGYGVGTGIERGLNHVTGGAFREGLTRAIQPAGDAVNNLSGGRLYGGSSR